MKKLLTFICALSFVTGCATNPVTGKSELRLMSESREMQIGEENYLPVQQSQGGQYTADPALAEYVREVGNRIAAVSDRDLPYEFVVVNDSTPNAWALPGGKIGVNRGLLMTLDNEAELAALLGHEVVHAAARHGAKSQERNMLFEGALLAIDKLTDDNKYSSHIVAGAKLGAGLLGHKYSRGAELEADQYGQNYMARAGYDPSAAASLHEKFLALSEGEQTSWLEGLFATHPPSEERLLRNRENTARIKSEMPGKSWELGAERYQRKLAYLASKQEAYSAFEQAAKLAKSGERQTAIRRIDQAIGIEPREARFYGLKADMLLDGDRAAKAVELYTEAARLDPQYYEYYVGRGLGYEKLGRHQQARADFESSNRLLPTATAALKLGQFALRDGDRAAAKSYFQSAMSAEGPLRPEARRYFVRLDMTDNPQPYFPTESRIAGGRLETAIANRSGFDVNGVDVRFRATINGVQMNARAFSRAMPANGVATVYPGWRIGGNDRVENFQARVVAVDI